MRLLLDTHVWWWWVTGEPGLSAAQKRALAKASPEEPLQISDKPVGDRDTRLLRQARGEHPVA